MHWNLSVNTVTGAKVLIHFHVPIGEFRIYLPIYLNLIYQITLCRAPESNDVNSDNANYTSKIIYH
jgi:hypothetical protein